MNPLGPARSHLCHMVAGKMLLPTVSAGEEAQPSLDPKVYSTYSRTELDACVVENRKYTADEYKCLTPLQQQKLRMLHNPRSGRTSGQGLTHQYRTGPPDRSSAVSTTSSTGKCNHEEGTNNCGNATVPDKDKTPKWKWHRSNLAFQGH
jgi:hypothetical protein